MKGENVMKKIILTEKLRKYLQEKTISYLLAKVSFFSEGCVLIKEPKFEVLNANDLEEFQANEKITKDQLTLYISDDFNEIFGSEEEFYLDLKGVLRKKIIIKNIQPIMKRTCKA